MEEADILELYVGDYVMFGIIGPMMRAMKFRNRNSPNEEVLCSWYVDSTGEFKNSWFSRKMLTRVMGGKKE